MNRKQRMVAAIRAMASQEFSRNLEWSTTYCVAAMVLAMDAAHCKVNWDKWFKAFSELYPQVLADPMPYIKQAEEVADLDIEIHWTE